MLKKSTKTLKWHLKIIDTARPIGSRLIIILDTHCRPGLFTRSRRWLQSWKPYMRILGLTLVAAVKDAASAGGTQLGEILFLLQTLWRKCVSPWIVYNWTAPSSWMAEWNQQQRTERRPAAADVTVAAAAEVHAGSRWTYPCCRRLLVEPGR